jgi:uncharacterized OsmC-like protein
VLRRVHVRYTLRAEAKTLAEKADAIVRAFDLHPPRCPVARSIGSAVKITTELSTEAL